MWIRTADCHITSIAIFKPSHLSRIDYFWVFRFHQHQRLLRAALTGLPCRLPPANRFLPFGRCGPSLIVTVEWKTPTPNGSPTYGCKWRTYLIYYLLLIFFSRFIVSFKDLTVYSMRCECYCSTKYGTTSWLSTIFPVTLFSFFIPLSLGRLNAHTPLTPPLTASLILILTWY